MGLPIATRLASALERLIVADLSADRVAAARAAAPSITSEDAGSADVVFLCLPTSPTARSVIEDMISAGDRQRTIIDFGAHAQTFAEEMSVLCRANSAVYCDAPVFGTPPMAAAGDLYFLFSGPEPIYLDFHALAAKAGFRTRQAGATGTASTIKLLQNALGIANTLAAAEVLRLCEASGIATDMFASVVAECGGVGGSSVFERFVDDMIARYDSGEGRLRIAAKDMSLVAGMAGRLNISTPFLSEAAEQFGAAMEAGYGERQFTDIIDFDPIERK
ncbi:MAG: NAD(P)-dependent oxidoreductase [Alphaproteobacteria bacterium]